MGEPIRALFLLHTAQPSGAELSTLRLLTQLRRDGMDARVLSLADGPVLELLAERGIPARVDPVSNTSTRIGSGPAQLLRGAAQLLGAGWRIAGGIAPADRPQVLVAESTKTLVLGSLIALRWRIPLVWRVHDRITAEYFGRPVSLAVRLLGAVTASGYLVNSRSTGDTLWTLGKPIAVCFPGVEAASGQRGQREQAEPDQVVLAMAGRITEWKGQDVLLSALAGMRNRPRVRFFGGALFGEQDYRQRLLEQVDELGLGDRVTFTGHLDDLLTALGECDIAVHCSRKAEPFGQVIVEAMAVGLVPVATAPGGPSEIITDGQDGMLTRPEDPQELGRTLDRLIEDQPLRRRLAAAAHRRSQDFSVAAGARVAADLLHRVGRRRR